ncbi:MAG TPA: arsinothricin resistance N-acetyltransferase ArsN1 family B [Allosphingosinicella sp.]|nr:arsinothricin resistance N-acetyltransferase ArsN1 family B [Allosphingosinicella sp.]
MTALRAARPDDAAAIAAIYAPFVTDTAVTFETEPLSAAGIAERMRAAAGRYPWLVATDEAGAVTGYAYATKFRERAAYRFAVETTVYVDPRAQRRGIASTLYRRLLDGLAVQGFTQALGVITIPNEPSIRFHEAMGFARAGVFRQVGYKLGAWHDVGYWQRPLAPSTIPAPEPKLVAQVME